MQRRGEQGQAIVIMAFAVVAMAALVGLAIDGGRAYSDRRQVQNTADAAAMAGVRVLAQHMVECAARSVASDNAVGYAIADFANRNGIAVNSSTSRVRAWYVNAADQPVGEIGVGLGIPLGATGVQVSVAMTDTTTFLKVVGQDRYQVAASTVAVADYVHRETNRMSGQGVLPIAVYEGVIQGLSPGQTFEAWDSGADYCGNLPCDFAGSHVPGSLHGWLNMNWIYNKDAGTSGILDRALAKNVGNDGCAFNADGTVNVPGTGLKGYAGLDGNSCPYPYDIYTGDRYDPDNERSTGLNGDWIHGEPGVRASTLQAVASGHPVGSTVWLPVFDRARDPDWMREVFGGSSSYWPTGGGGTNAANHHIIGFVQATIEEVVATGNPKYISVTFVDSVIVSGESSSGIIVEAVSGGDGLNPTACTPNGLVAISMKH